MTFDASSHVGGSGNGFVIPDTCTYLPGMIGQVQWSCHGDGDGDNAKLDGIHLSIRTSRMAGMGNHRRFRIDLHEDGASIYQLGLDKPHPADGPVAKQVLGTAQKLLRCLSFEDPLEKACGMERAQTVSGKALAKIQYALGQLQGEPDVPLTAAAAGDIRNLKNHAVAPPLPQVVEKQAQAQRVASPNARLSHLA